ncbi:GTP-binding nuclear protein Ran1B-like [Prunus dulcis]|nr:GTP-binding nuclear protein Ran1B-like [Prunus dulcis]
MMGDKNIGFKMENNITLPYFEISANNNPNLEAPFSYLNKRLTENDERLSVKPQPPGLIPLHIQMPVTAAQHGPESGPAAAQPFPVEDNNGCCCACLKPLVECLKACYYIVSIWDAFMNCLEEA